MSNEEKQIEEMANITRVWCEIDNSCGSCHWETCNECLAECLIKAGYRKASEVALEVIDELIEKVCDKYEIWTDSDEREYHYTFNLMQEVKAELKKKYESEDNK